MSHPTATMQPMNATLERLIALKADTTTTGQMDYLDQVLSDAVTICRRPGDVERCATYIDELIEAVAAARATHGPQRRAEAPPAPEPTRGGTDPHRTTSEPSTGTGAHRAQEPA